MTLLEINLSQLPSFSDMVIYYGPFLGLVVSIVLFYNWQLSKAYKKRVDDKNEEIQRGVVRESEMHTRLMQLIDKLNSK